MHSELGQQMRANLQLVSCKLMKLKLQTIYDKIVRNMFKYMLQMHATEPLAIF